MDDIIINMEQSDPKQVTRCLDDASRANVSETFSAD